jgi:hypothetical protein
MVSFKSIDSMIMAIEDESRSSMTDNGSYRKIIKENDDLIKFLRFLEKTNPCNQEYFLYKKVIIISYMMRWEFFKLGKNHSFSGGFRIIGLPVSLSNPGYLIAEGDEETKSSIDRIIREAADSLKGITIVLNADRDISGGRLAPSTFVFYNKFSTFQEYLGSLRSSYRRKMNAILHKGRELCFNKLEKGCFTQEHHDLYLSVCERASMIFRTLSFEYFRDCEAEVFEIRDKQNRLLAMIQLKDIERDLYFLYVGFRKDDEKAEDLAQLNHIDLYFNVLLFIIKYGIKKGYRRIVFGQTSAESKSKVGCAEELKYMYMTSSNPLTKAFFRMFPRFYSFKPYNVIHNVFKEM